MKFNIFINNKLYKTVTVQGDTFNPTSIWPQIEADKKSGLLSSYGVSEQLSIKIEKAKN